MKHRRSLGIALLAFASAAVTAHAAESSFTLTGWSAIPSSLLRDGPISGQFANGANGVEPPYEGQPIPGYSGMRPLLRPDVYIALPDNGFGSQGNSADFTIGFYFIAPQFKAESDGTTAPGPVEVRRFIPFSDPEGFSTPVSSPTVPSTGAPPTTRIRASPWTRASWMVAG